MTSNKDIRVWNLSLGSNDEVNANFISAEAAVLDQIQFENDVIFVIAGTNKKSNEGEKRIGAPADSINSVIVNSVDSGKVRSVFRKGIVLSFFTKPDVSYYGGGTRQSYSSL
ncbi:MAG: S8 family serine peptidase [Trichococcus flocculiformis]